MLLAICATVLTSTAIGACPDQWSGPAAPVFDGPINALIEYTPPGSPSLLVAGGEFTHITGAGGVQPVNCLAAWNGSTWAPLGSPITETTALPVVHALVVLDGDLVASGAFSLATGQPFVGVARYRTGVWQPLGGTANGSVRALAVVGGVLHAAGDFTMIDGQQAARTARWNGAAWEPLGGGVNGTVHELAGFAGNLYACGDFTSAFSPTTALNGIAWWNGSAWQRVGSHATVIGLSSQVPGMTISGRALLAFDNELVLGGYFSAVDGVSANRIARFDGTIWRAMGSVGGSGSATSHVAALASYQGSVVAAGFRVNLSPLPPSNWIARWDGAAWTDFGLPAASGVRALASFGTSLHAGGSFTSMSGISTPQWARWSAGCLADFNCDGGITVQDIFDFLTAYFTSSAAADINADDAVTVQDIFDFLVAYFASCA